MSWISWILIGLIMGAIARSVLPGRTNGGWVTSLIIGVIGAIVGEYMGASAGLGWVISYATSFFNVDRVMSCIFILFFVGIVFNMALKHVEKVLLKWRPPLDYSGTL